MAALRRHWFLVALLLCIVLAWLWPSALLPGAATASWLQRGCVVGIFLLSGLTLRTRELGAGIGHWRLHLTVQAFSFVLVPLLFWALDGVWAAAGLSPGLRRGLLVLSCLPTTVTSCVALCAVARGNEVGALVNATFGNLLGIVLTPLWLLALIGRSGAVDIGAVLGQLAGMVLLPVLVGQLLQLPLGAALTPGRRRALGQSVQVLVLSVLLLVLTRSFAADATAPGGAVAAVALISFGAHLLLLLAAWALAALPALRLDRRDRIAVLFCAPQKTIAFGVPLIALLFPDGAELAAITLPLLFYHPFQLIVGALLAAALAARAPDDAEGRPS